MNLMLYGKAFMMLVHFNILDELLSEEEYLEGVTWLKDYQHLTKDYQDKELEL